MNDDTRLAALLREVAAGVDPRERLRDIRAEVDPGGGWSTRRRWAVGGAAAVAASALVAFGLGAGGSYRTSPHPAAPATPIPSTASDPDAAGPGIAVTVYYIGDTPAGPRLFREVRTVDSNPIDSAVRAAVGRDERGRPEYPVDTDYRTVWPPLTVASARLGARGDVIEVSLGGDPQRDLRRRGYLPPMEARLAVEALVRTAQDAAGGRLPVHLLLFDRPADRVLGVPSSEPLDISPDLDVLSEVSLTSPAENLLVDNDDPFTVRGVGRTSKGGVTVDLVPVIGDAPELSAPVVPNGSSDGLVPFEVTFDLHGVEPGDYDVIARAAGGSGGRSPTDTRTITVVD